MTELKTYLAEEIATDCADGLLTRREALRRLGMLGVTALAASAMLAACGDDDAAAPAGTSSSSSGGSSSGTSGTSGAVGTSGTVPTGDAGGDAGGGPTSAIPTQAITFPGPENRTLQGAFAAATAPRGAVLVIHENKGLTDHIRNVAGRFGAVGYSALALDLLSEEGGTGSFSEEAAATAALGNIDPTRFVADMKAALDELAKRAPGVKLGAIGFCFGGGMVWRLIASKDTRLAAAAPFYGPLPENADFTGAAAAVVGIYGALDTRVTGTRDAAKTALDKAGLKNEMVTYEGADHAFFNDTGARYNANAAGQAWLKVNEWFAANLA